MSAIEWTGETWNPLAGCSVKSPGCKNCYAMRRAWMLAHNPHPKIAAKYAGTVRKVNGKPVWTGRINFDETTLLAPLAWRKPRQIFVNSMSDLFHKDVPAEFIGSVYGVMSLCPQHDFQVLTKRSARARTEMAEVAAQAQWWVSETTGGAEADAALERLEAWPLDNVWFGVSVEKRRYLDRLEDLRQTPAAVRFLSLEPLLEDLGELDLSGIDQVIVGGESGPHARRPPHSDCVRAIREFCVAAGVAFFFKGWGAWLPAGEDGAVIDGEQIVNASNEPIRIGKKRAGRLLDRREWNEVPARADTPAAGRVDGWRASQEARP